MALGPTYTQEGVTMATRQFKTATVAVKAGPDDGDLAEGEFLGYASVFGNVDSYGEIVEPGAFTGTLTEWKDSGQNIPVLWGHDFFDPFSNIGHAVTAVEDEKGLLIRGLLDMENAKAAQVYRLLKQQRVGQMSFAYEVIDGAEGKDGFHLKQLKLYEVSIVPVGANQETEILAVKANAAALVNHAKAGRVLAEKHIESLRDAQGAIGAVIKAAESTVNSDEDQKGKAAEDHKGKAAEDHSGKSAALAIITQHLSLKGN